MPYSQILLRKVICFALISLLVDNVSASDFSNDHDVFILKYLKQNSFNLDTSANAVMLYESKTIDFVSSNITIKRVIKILKKDGNKYADIAIPINSGIDYNVGIRNVSGTTYNLIDGQIDSRKIDEDNVHVENSSILKEKKISMPGVVDGSIIEYSFVINGYTSFRWAIQEDIPKLYTQLAVIYQREVSFDYVDNGVVFIKEDSHCKSMSDSLLPNTYTYNDPLSYERIFWVRKNVPAFHEEPYMPCSENYKEQLKIQVRSIIAGIIRLDLSKWDFINYNLLQDFNFFRSMSPLGRSVKSKADELVAGEKNELEMAQKIYRFVSDSVSYNGVDDLFTNKNLSKVLEDKEGNSADKNFLLIGMLKHEGLDCSPLIIATKDEQTTYATQLPALNNYNKVIALLNLNGEKYYLDASERYNPFGILPLECYNGYARVIDKKDTFGLILKPQMTSEKSLFTVTTVNNDAKHYQLNYKCYFSNEESEKLRNEWCSDSATIKKAVKDIIKDCGFDAKVENFSVLNLQNADKQLTLDFIISFEWPENGMVYFSPFVKKIFDKNPFTADKRKYPVQFPALQDHSYSCNIKLPEGYEIEDMPKSVLIKIGIDQYRCSFDYNREDNTMILYSRLQIPDITFGSSGYTDVKEFFEKMAAAQQQTVVIKIKK